MKKERRFFQVDSLRVETDERKVPTIKGHAAVFNELSVDLGGLREKILPGAFSEVLGKDVRALLNHDKNFVLGRTKSGTLSVQEDERGLLVDIQPPGSQWANDLLVCMDRGDIDQMSFHFVVDPEGEEWSKADGENIRTISKFSQLFDVSVVTFPAYEGTDAQVRSLFTSEGLDYDALARILVRHERGLEMSQEDRAVVETTIGIFREIVPELPSSEDSRNDKANPDPEFTAELDLLSGRIDLLEQSIRMLERRLL